MIPQVKCGNYTLGAEQKWKQGDQLVAMSTYQERDGGGVGQSGCSVYHEECSELVMGQYGVGNIKTITEGYIVFDAIKYLYAN